MRTLVTSDATTLSYWLNWRVLICVIWVLAPMFIAIYVIWKCERSDHTASEKGTQQERIELFYDGETWRPCLKEIHPFWLLAFRVVAFFLLLGTLISDFVVHGADILYYYTQWTFLLVTIYFGFGSLLSTYGCYQHYKMCKAFNGHDVGIDAEQGLYMPLTYKETTYKVRAEKGLNFQEKNDNFPNTDILSRAFQVIFQMSAGAVILTDCVYWFIIFPFLTIKDYDLNALTVLTHSLNAIVLLGDATLNSLPYPWFRISYFILWTGVYVIFQWVIHAFVPLLWWPYPILDLSGTYAPLWYLVVALMHIPCYGAFALIMKFKHFLLSRLFPQSYQGLR